MRKLIAAINMTLDGFCDHTAIIPDQELHQHFADLLSNADVILYGRITYQLMEYWKAIVENPTGNKSTDEFAVLMNSIPKIVFSRKLKSVEWETAKLAKGTIEEEVSALLRQPGKDILAGSRSMIVNLMNLNLLDELQLTVHPVIAAGGLPLFDKVHDRTIFELLKTKIFKSGAVTFYYRVNKNK